MLKNRKNYNAARQAIESASGRYEQSSDKQSDGGLVSVTVEGLNKTRDLVNQLRESTDSQEFKLDVLDKLEKTLDDMVVK